MYLDYDRYDQLVERHLTRYDASRLARIGNEVVEGYVDLIPFFGRDSINPADIAIACDPDPYRIEDKNITSYAKEIAARMRQDGRLYDGPQVARITSFDLNPMAPSLQLQPVDYDLIASTGLALDLKHPLFKNSGGTLRDYCLSHPEPPELTNNPIPTCLGICGLLLIETDNKKEVLVTKRSPRLASLENTLGPSSAGHIDFDTSCRNLAELIDRGMRQEVCEELNLTDEQFQVVPLALATELFRGERPQLFCLISTKLDRSAITEALEAIPIDDREHSEYLFLALKDSGNEPEFNYELKMNLALILQFLGGRLSRQSPTTTKQLE